MKSKIRHPPTSVSQEISPLIYDRNAKIEDNNLLYEITINFYNQELLKTIDPK